MADSTSRIIEVIHNCRLCNSRSLEHSFALPETPLANDFRPMQEQKLKYDRYPLELLRCTTCSHVQLRHVVDPVSLFSNYAYVSGTSTTFVNHFKNYATWIQKDLRLDPTSKILEIGSNDGTLLKFLKTFGYQCIGIDPAGNIVNDIDTDDIELICSFFDRSIAVSIKEKYGELDLIVANNVFAHIWKLRDAISEASELLRADGYLVFEVSYLLDVIEKCLFDTIYHEHLDYHSLTALTPFLESLGLTVIDAIRVDTHGGSIRIVAQKNKTTSSTSTRVIDLLNAERAIGIGTGQGLKNLNQRIGVLASRGKSLLNNLRASNARIVGFGAPAKMTTLVYTFGITHGIFDYIVDDSALKQYKLAPGGHSPIYPSNFLYEERPDYIFILAWNFASAISASHQEFAGRFIVPVPEIAFL